MVRYSAKHLARFSGHLPDFLSLFFTETASCELYVIEVLYYVEKDAVVVISAGNQASRKGKQCQIMQPKIWVEVARHAG